MLLRILAALVPVALLLPGPPAPAPTSIDQLVQRYRSETGLPGAAVVVTHGRTVVHSAGYGHTPDGTPVTDRTPMGVASLSKSVTALAVLQLVDAGRVGLDDPVRAHLPEFTTADPRSGRITVRQLLDQTSGLTDRTDGSAGRPQARTLAEAVAGMRDARLATDPGTHWAYHDANYQVAARLVERVTGEPFADRLRRSVFDPLGMTDTTTVDTDRDLPATAHGHLRILGTGVALPEPPAFGNGSGGVVASARDLGAWLVAQNDGGRGPSGNGIVSAAGMAALHTPSPASGSYALGWFVGRTPSGQPQLEHAGDQLTFTADQVLLPASGYGIAVLANTGTATGDATALADRIVALIEGRPVAPANPVPTVVDGVLLAVAVVAALLGVAGVVRSRRWAVARQSRRRVTAARLLPLLVPPLLLATVDRIAGVLYRGRDVTWQQTAYLYPTVVLLLAVASPACVAVLVARLNAVRTRSRRPA